MPLSGRFYEYLYQTMSYYKNIILLDSDARRCQYFADTLGQACQGLLIRSHPVLESLVSENTITDIIFMETSHDRAGCYKTIEILRTKRPFTEIPIIVFSNNRDPQHEVECFVRGANRYFVQPEDPIRFAAVLKEIVSGQLDVLDVNEYNNFVIMP